MTKTDAIFATYPNVVTIRGNVAYDAGENVIQYDEDVVNAYIQSHTYIARRQAEYPSYADQFDTIFHQGLDAWKAQIQAIKDKYPKS